MRKIILFFFYSLNLFAELPSGSTTISGDVSLTTDDQTLTIQQQSDQAIIEWNSFNIGENNTVILIFYSFSCECT